MKVLSSTSPRTSLVKEFVSSLFCGVSSVSEHRVGISCFLYLFLTSVGLESEYPRDINNFWRLSLSILNNLYALNYSNPYLFSLFCMTENEGFQSDDLLVLVLQVS